MARYVDAPATRRDVAAAADPFSILLVISQPNDLNILDVEGEERLIREALDERVVAGQVALDTLTDARTKAVVHRLRERAYSAVHFIGHGCFDEGQGHIALVGEDGDAEWLDDASLADMFLGNRHTGLVVLNSCEGTEASTTEVFAGTAPRLVRRGIPAVVAMQWTIRDDTAKVFADEFYRTVALGWPVDAAMQSARSAISIRIGMRRRDFATPVLYMRAKDGVIFRPK